MPRVAKSKKDNALTGVHARKTPVLYAPGGKLSDEPPAGLNADARAAWIAAINSCPDGYLTVVNIGILERWCRNYARYRKLENIIDHNDMFTVTETGKKVISEEMKLKDIIEKSLRADEKELGFTPASRGRVRTDARDDDDVNPFDFDA